MTDLHSALTLQARRTLAVILAGVALAFLLGAGCGSECAEPSCAEAAAQVCAALEALDEERTDG